MDDAEHPNSGKRIQFEFSADAFDRLTRMKESSERATYAEVVRDSLRVYEWVMEQQKAGYDLGLVSGDTLIKTVKLFF